MFTTSFYTFPLAGMIIKTYYKFTKLNLSFIKSSLVIILVSINLISHAQENEMGFPFVENFPPKTYGFESQNYSIVEDKQGSGRGLLASAVRLNGARLQDYENFVVRTKNERVLSILRRIFSGQEGRLLFVDPEKNAPWYTWGFESFDKERILNLLSTVEQE